MKKHFYRIRKGDFPMKTSIKRAATHTLALALCSFSFSLLLCQNGAAHESVLIGAGSGKTDIVITDTPTDYSGETSQITEISTAESCLTESQLYEEHAMLSDTVYEIDLDRDGQAESIYYHTYTGGAPEQGSSNAVLEIYNDGQLFWSYTDPNWSYNWDLSHFTLEDGSTYLLAVSKSDNDWSTQGLILALETDNDTFSVLADLTELTRQADEAPANSLSSWSRIGYGDLLTTTENIVSVPWTDNTKCTGNMTIYVDYEISENIVTQADTVLRLDENRTWTSWQEFDVYEEIGSSNVLFHVSADDVVSLTEMTTVNGQTYLKCVNASGQEGWFPDAEEYLHMESSESPDGYYQGYFKECIFAG